MHRSGHPRSGEQPVTEIRAEVVARLASTALADLPAVIAEEGPTGEELTAAADTLAIMAQSELQESGRLAPSRSVLELRMSQAQAVAAVYGIIERGSPGAWANGDPTLADRLKLLPGEFAHHVTRILASVGLLDPADVAGGDDSGE
jgi:hypothetical protein